MAKAHMDTIDVDDAEQNPEKSKKHKKEPAKDAEAKLYVDDFDVVLWKSKDPFRVVRIEEVGKDGINNNPFYIPTNAMIAVRDGLRWVVNSGPPKKDLFKEGDADTKYYKGIFKRITLEGADKAGAGEIDPHISIHRGERKHKDKDKDKDQGQDQNKS